MITTNEQRARAGAGAVVVFGCCDGTEEMRAEVERRRAERPNPYSKAGAELLDEIYPEWYTHIRLDVLNLASPMDCILGQLGHRDGGRDGFYSVVRALFEEGSRYGVPGSGPKVFGFVGEGYDPALPDSWRDLERGWKYEIKKRQGA